MATTAAHPERVGIRGPNIASADVQLPAVRDYEQVDRDIIATLGFTKKWFLGLGIAVLAMLCGLSAWLYQISQYLPYYYMIYFPAAILTGRLDLAAVVDLLEMALPALRSLERGLCETAIFHQNTGQTARPALGERRMAR